MTDEDKDIEASFRSSLKDVVLMVERLAPHCQTIEELLGMLQLGCENDGQLRLLMNRIIRKGGK